MRWTQTLIPTLKEAPEGAEIPSHVLMLRAGMIARVMAGAYGYLPLGLRALRKAEAIVRREMGADGAIELALPALTPFRLWRESGRADELQSELIRLTLPRRDRRVQVALAPSHEEVVTELAARYLSSYRQLPITLYQIQPKFRNPERPRFGVLRTSQFLTADAYSFDRSDEALDQSYQRIYAAYCRVLDRCGLSWLAAEAENDLAGSEPSHEFVVAAANGEETIAHCGKCGYAANLRCARVGPLGLSPPDVPPEPVRRVDTPGATTIEQVSTMLGCKPSEMIKTLIYTADERPIAVLIRGDHEANEHKIRRAAGAGKLEMAGPDVIQEVTGAPVGFAGPVGMKQPVPIWVDRDVEFIRNAVTGANEADAHLTGVNAQRDFPVENSADLRNAIEGDPCPRCSARLSLDNAIEVGHVFRLGTRYSEALGTRLADEHEQLRPVLMGSYHLGIDRLLAALVETSHDADGIIWPVALAPYEVLLMPLHVAEGETVAVADQLHDDLTRAGIDVLLDDRDQRAGVKFKDADLVGIPMRVVIGPRGLEHRQLEIKWRWDAEPGTIDLDTAAEHVAELIRKEREDGARFKSRHTLSRKGSTS
jgi:prolyl-tRNA synthetase